LCYLKHVQQVPIEIFLGNFCHFHCYGCCCCVRYEKKNFTKRKRITGKGHFCRNIFLHEFVHVGCGILNRAWFVCYYLCFCSVRVGGIILFSILRYIFCFDLGISAWSKQLIQECFGSNNCMWMQVSSAYYT
jgi:hypothetical protein